MWIGKCNYFFKKQDGDAGGWQKIKVRVGTKLTGRKWKALYNGADPENANTYTYVETFVRNMQTIIFMRKNVYPQNANIHFQLN